MRPPEHSVSVELEVPFHDVDSLHIVWHGHYFKYFELARTAFMRGRGLDVAEVVEAGYAMLVVDSRCRHSFPLRYGDRFRVTAWCVEWQHRVRIRFELWNMTHDRRSARGHTVLVTTDLGGALLFETPDVIRHALAK